MAIEIVAEALPADLCHEKFDQELNTVDLVGVGVNVKAEDDAMSTGKKRGRPKKIESPVSDGKICQHKNTLAALWPDFENFGSVSVKEEPDVEDSYEYQLMYDCEPVIKDDDDDDDDDTDNFVVYENDQNEIQELEKELENLSEYEKPKRKRTRKSRDTDSGQPVTLVHS